jgi:hypothetical protein
MLSRSNACSKIVSGAVQRGDMSAAMIEAAVPAAPDAVHSRLEEMLICQPVRLPDQFGELSFTVTA